MTVSTFGDTSMWVQEVDVADDKVAPGKYNQIAYSEQWSDSMLGETTALKKRGCWRVIRIPEGVKLIKSRSYIR